MVTRGSIWFLSVESSARSIEARRDRGVLGSRDGTTRPKERIGDERGRGLTANHFSAVVGQDRTHNEVLADWTVQVGRPPSTWCRLGAGDLGNAGGEITGASSAEKWAGVRSLHSNAGRSLCVPIEGKCGRVRSCRTSLRRGQLSFEVDLHSVADHLRVFVQFSSGHMPSQRLKCPSYGGLYLSQWLALVSAHQSVEFPLVVLGDALQCRSNHLAESSLIEFQIELQVRPFA